MRLLIIYLVTFICILCTNCHSSKEKKEHINGLITTIAFGSCGHESKPQPILSIAADHQPDVFVFLGDNIYGDTKIMDTLSAKYQRLGIKSEFKELWNKTQVIATWDDHDFGWNDSGRHYPFKAESKNIFLDFWKADSTDIRREREGIYTSYFYEGEGKTVQIILLDTRTFRDNLLKYDNDPIVDTTEYHYHLDYSPHHTPDSTLLGTAQWQWLEDQLKIPADVRIIGSSTQFGISWNGYEAWANFPKEQQKFLNLIKKTKANGIVFISGDVHYAEISKLETDGLYPIYDITSSGITSTWHFATPNTNRIEGPVMENHFGMIEIDWAAKMPNLTMKIIDISGDIRFKKTVNLNDLIIQD